MIISSPFTNVNILFKNISELKAAAIAFEFKGSRYEKLSESKIALYANSLYKNLFFLIRLDIELRLLVEHLPVHAAACVKLRVRAVLLDVPVRKHRNLIG